MIIHIALFKWRKNISRKDILQIMDDVLSMKGKIKEIIDLSCGRNFSKWSKGYTHAVVVKVKDKKALDKYRKHPIHIPIAKRIEELEQDSIGIDFKI
jgi:hypothetical protein